MIEIFEEFEKFNHITFYDDTHSYIINGQKATSVTTLIHQYEKPFDEDYWANRNAAKEGCTPEELKAKWKYKNQLAQIKGTLSHSYVENLLARKVFPYDDTRSKAVFEGVDPVKPRYEKITTQINAFIEATKGRLIPIKSELVVGDEDYLVCGMIDQIFYNKKSGKLEIWDWKTNGKLTTESNYRLTGLMSDIPDSKLDIYSLQLGIYKHLIEKNTNLTIGDRYLVWFQEDNDTYKIVKCHDYAREVKVILAAHKKSLVRV